MPAAVETWQIEIQRPAPHTNLGETIFYPVMTSDRFIIEFQVRKGGKVNIGKVRIKQDDDEKGKLER